MQVVGVNGTYQDAFPLFKSASPAMVIFLGSTIGNLCPEESSKFLGDLSAHLSPGDYFLLGADLVKETALLEAAYNDAAGVTEAFTRNLFVRMNRELGSGIDVTAVDHVAHYNPEADQIEISARFNTAQQVRVAPLERSFALEAGEEIRTEISRKFKLPKLLNHLESFGFQPVEVFTDPRQWFGLILLRRQAVSPSPIEASA